MHNLDRIYWFTIGRMPSTMRLISWQCLSKRVHWYWSMASPCIAAIWTSRARAATHTPITYWKLTTLHIQKIIGFNYRPVNRLNFCKKKTPPPFFYFFYHLDSNKDTAFWIEQKLSIFRNSSFFFLLKIQNSNEIIILIKYLLLYDFGRMQIFMAIKRDNKPQIGNKMFQSICIDRVRAWTLFSSIPKWFSLWFTLFFWLFLSISVSGPRLKHHLHSNKDETTSNQIIYID